MNFQNLHQFVQRLEANQDLKIIRAPVDSSLELAEIHRRVIAANGPALLFTNIKNKSFPVLSNMFGTRERVQLAFGEEAITLIKQASMLPETFFPFSLKKVWTNRNLLKKAFRVGLKQTLNAPVLQKTLPNADLHKLPAIVSWPEDGGAFLTLPLVHTKSPSKGIDNLGMYRVQIFSANETGMHFQIGKGGGFHLYEAEQMQQNLPTNIYLGGPPALILAAIAPLPENIPEILLASLVAGQKLTTTKNPKSLIPIFSECEFCITGQVIAKKRRPEGPFGDHYGYYSLIHDYPVFQAQAVYHRKNAIYPATIVGKPRQEDYYIGEYLQDLLKPLISLAMPGVKDLHSYGETGFHALAGAVLKERYTKESLSTVFRILGEGQLSLTKFLIGIHEDHDLKDFTELLTYILKRVQWENDLSIFADTSMDSLDYTGHKINHGSKGALLVGKEIRRKLPHKLPNSLPESLIQKAGVFCPGCLVLETTTDLKQITHAKMLEDWPLIVAVDDVKKALYSETSFLWTTFTRFDPAQDIIPRAQTIQRNRLVFSGPIAIDARMKPSYPKELFCDQKTSQLVNNRWFEYFPDKDVEMGSSDYAHLR